MPSETALLLTQQEWEDVAHMVAHYRACTEWVRRAVAPEEHEDLIRKRALADRIIDAAEV